MQISLPLSCKCSCLSLCNRILPWVRFLRSSEAAKEYLEQGVNVPEKQRLAKQEVYKLYKHNNKDVWRRGYTLSCGNSCIKFWTPFQHRIIHSLSRGIYC